MLTYLSLQHCQIALHNHQERIEAQIEGPYHQYPVYQSNRVHHQQKTVRLKSSHTMTKDAPLYNNTCIYMQLQQKKKQKKNKKKTWSYNSLNLANMPITCYMYFSPLPLTSIWMATAEFGSDDIISSCLLSLHPMPSCPLPLNSPPQGSCTGIGSE